MVPPVAVFPRLVIIRRPNLVPVVVLLRYTVRKRRGASLAPTTTRLPVFLHFLFWAIHLKFHIWRSGCCKKTRKWNLRWKLVASSNCTKTLRNDDPRVLRAVPRLFRSAAALEDGGESAGLAIPTEANTLPLTKPLTNRHPCTWRSTCSSSCWRCKQSQSPGRSKTYAKNVSARRESTLQPPGARPARRGSLAMRLDWIAVMLRGGVTLSLCQVQRKLSRALLGSTPTR